MNIDELRGKFPHLSEEKLINLSTKEKTILHIFGQGVNVEEVDDDVLDALLEMKQGSVSIEKQMLPAYRKALNIIRAENAKHWSDEGLTSHTNFFANLWDDSEDDGYYTNNTMLW